MLRFFLLTILFFGPLRAQDLILADLVDCLGDHAANYEYETTATEILVYTKFLHSIPADAVLDECLRNITRKGYNCVIGPRQDIDSDYWSDDSQYSGPVGNALDPISDDDIYCAPLPRVANNRASLTQHTILRRLTPRAKVWGREKSDCEGDNVCKIDYGSCSPPAWNTMYACLADYCESDTVFCGYNDYRNGDSHCNKWKRHQAVLPRNSYWMHVMTAVDHAA